MLSTLWIQQIYKMRDLSKAEFKKEMSMLKSKGNGSVMDGIQLVEKERIEKINNLSASAYSDFIMTING